MSFCLITITSFIVLKMIYCLSVLKMSLHVNVIISACTKADLKISGHCAVDLNSILKK